MVSQPWIFDNYLLTLQHETIEQEEDPLENSHSALVPTGEIMVWFENVTGGYSRNRHLPRASYVQAALLLRPESLPALGLQKAMQVDVLCEG